MGVGVASHAVVLDVGHVAVVTVHDVSDGLAAAVGEVYAVHALGVVTVAAFPVVEVVAGGGVPDSPLEVVLGPGELVRLEGLEGVTLQDKEDSCESVMSPNCQWFQPHWQCKQRAALLHSLAREMQRLHRSQQRQQQQHAAFQQGQHGTTAA